MLCSRDKVPGGVRGDMSTKLATLACVGVLAAACASPKVQPAADTGLAADTKATNHQREPVGRQHVSGERGGSHSYGR